MKRVLDVGQCDFDHSNIKLLVESLGATIVMVPLPSEALELLKKEEFDLVLVNRIIDSDGSEGLPLIRQIKEDPNTKDIPVMLVSNFEDAQDTAVALGAEPGFGKSEINSSQTSSFLKKLLS